MKTNGIVWIIFNFFALRLLAWKSNVPLFRTGALMLLTGAVVGIAATPAFTLLGSYIIVNYSTLSAMSAPGSIIQGIAWIILAKAYFAIPRPSPQPLTQSHLSPDFGAQSAPGQTRYCQYCGFPSKLDTSYCTRCRHKL